MTDNTYQSKIYKKPGGEELVVASGGKITTVFSSFRKAEWSMPAVYESIFRSASSMSSKSNFASRLGIYEFRFYVFPKGGPDGAA